MITEGTGIPVGIDIIPILDTMETEYYPSLLLLPERPGRCEAVTIEVERRLTERLIKQELTLFINSFQSINRLLKNEFTGNPFSFLSEAVATIKEKCLIEDVKEVARQTEQSFIAKLKSSGLDVGSLPIDRLYQVVEIPVTYTDIYLGNTAVHYKVFTKREVFIKAEDAF